MVGDGNSFLKRVQIFFLALKSSKYPNASTLAEAANCSRNTAMRSIERMVHEYGMPIAYDASSRGYFLKDPDYELRVLPPGRDELTALFLLKDLSSMIDSEDLRNALDALWLSAVTGNPTFARELHGLSQFFSSDLTSVGQLADAGVLEFVRSAASGESVEISYQSPWRHQEPRIYRGRILHIHYSDGSLYLRFNDENGREIVLNSSFIKAFSVLPYTVEIKNGAHRKATGWREGFGIWTNEELSEIEIQILPPAAQYFAAQTWHETQQDHFEGEVLIRQFRSMLSPELVRRVLSLGRFVKDIKPVELKRMVAEDVAALALSLRHSAVEGKIS